MDNVQKTNNGISYIVRKADALIMNIYYGRN
jgi:hypothetical protein